jgi:ADP-heptose:LPS heptosyltransferase
MAGWKANYFFSWLTSLWINRLRSPAGRRFGRILAIRLDEIGDVVTTLPALDALRKKFPDAEITAWLLPVTAPLLQHHPAVDAVVTQPPPPGRPFDLVVDFRGSYQTMRYALRRRPAFRLDRGTVRFRNKFFLKRHPHEILTNLQVVEPVTGKTEGRPPLVFPVSAESGRFAEQFLAGHGIGRFALFHTGSRKALKKWPGAHFAALGRRLHEEEKLDIVFSGVADELGEIEAIRRQMNFKTHVFAGQPLPGFAALAARAALFVGNDSGPMHLAAAAGAPVLGLFGPGEPHVFGPWGDRCALIHHKLECNPCDQVHCKYPDNPCMHRITVEEVAVKAKELISRPL